MILETMKTMKPTYTMNTMMKMSAGVSWMSSKRMRR
jgi:hypothetical protein